MTEQEKRTQRVQVRIDLEDAESNLVHLQVKANRLVDLIEAVLSKIRSNAALEPSRDDFALESELKTRLSPEEFSLLKSSGDAAVAVIAELRQERQKVLRLREQDAAISRATIRQIA